MLNRLRLVGEVFASALGRKQSDAELRAVVESRIAFETLIADLSSHFVNLDSDLIDGASRMRSGALSRRSTSTAPCLFQLSGKDGQLALSHYWTSPELIGGAISSIATVEKFPWAAAKVMKGELICFSRLDELPAEAALDREGFEAVDTKSNVTIPARRIWPDRRRA